MDGEASVFAGSVAGRAKDRLPALTPDSLGATTTEPMAEPGSGD